MDSCISQPVDLIARPEKLDVDHNMLKIKCTCEFKYIGGIVFAITSR